MYSAGLGHVAASLMNDCNSINVDIEKRKEFPYTDITISLFIERSRQRGQELPSEQDASHPEKSR